jgi:tRNA 2-selenouridine synthase
VSPLEARPALWHQEAQAEILMPTTLDSLAALAALPFDDIIDVRSPAEFAEDHIPGAINLPVLDNDERARVGTIYVQDDPFKARRVGAALVTKNAAIHLQGPLSDRPGGWRPLVYCWRGGQRSGSFTVILQQVGWRADTVAGGYKSFRRLVVRALYDDPLPHRIVLIDGGTGTAKTALLGHLAEAGAQVIDLEGMANHRGSVFGAMGAQPAQKMFESRIAMALAGCDPARPVFVEAEGNKVGNLLVPPALWKAMQTAPRIEISAPLEARVGFLQTAYVDLTEDFDRLVRRLHALRPYHGAETVAEWTDWARAGRFADLARALITAHYDPRYGRKAETRQPAPVLEVAGLAPEDLRDAALRIIAMTG